MIEIFLLSIIQGITEFLPISSSAHLIIFSNYLNLNNSNITLDISLHFGSLLAIIYFFKKKFQNYKKNKNLLKKIILTSIPVATFGYIIIKSGYIDMFRTFKTIGWTTIIFGILMYLSDFKKSSKNIKNNFYYKDAIILGFFQILSLLPGVSRSGITLTAARFLNFNRVDAAQLSFLTAIPVLVLVSIFNLKNIVIQNNLNFTNLNLAATLLSFIFSFLTIKFFLYYLRQFSLKIFVIYRLILGLVILFYVY